MTPTVTLMSAYLYSDAVRMITCAEAARSEKGLVGQREEETFSRSALLLLAFAFEAFVNEQRQEVGLTEEWMNDELRKEELKKQKPSGERNLPKTLVKFALLCTKVARTCPSFVVKPFDALVFLFDHRNELVHYSIKWERQTEIIVSEVRSPHYLELAFEMAHCWYSTVKYYLAGQAIEESTVGNYVGILTSYQSAYWRMLKRAVPSTSQQQASKTLPDLAILADETVSPSWTRHKNCQPYIYWDRRRCFTVLITVVNEMRVEQAGRLPVEQQLHLEVHPETATFPVGTHLREVTAVTAPDLVLGLNELLPQIREALFSPRGEWWESLDK